MSDAQDASKDPPAGGSGGEAEPRPQQTPPPDQPAGAAAPAADPWPETPQRTSGGSMFPAIVLLTLCAAAVIAILSLGGGEQQPDALTPEQVAQHLRDAERLLQEEHNPSEALLFLERAITAEPDNVHANVLIGAALISIGQSKESLVYLDHAAKLAPDDLSVLRHRAIALQDLQRWEEARPVWQRVLELVTERGGDPSSAHLQLATNFMFKGELTQAVDHLQAYLALQPNNAVAHQMHSDALGGLGRTADSIAAMESVVALVPNHIPTLHGLQTKRINYQGFTPVLELHASRAKDPAAAPVEHYLYARLLARVPGKLDEGRAEYEAALTGDPTLYWALEGLAQLDLRAQQPERARERLLHAIELANEGERQDPFLAGQVRLAAAERALGSYDAALERLRPLLEQPNYAFTAAVEYLGCLLDGGQTDKALEFAKAQNAGRPADAREAILLALVHRARGEPDAQREVLQAALDRQPKATGWLFELALLDLEQGRWDSARDRFATLLEPHPKDQPIVPFLAFWAGYAAAPTQPETARERWTRGRKRARVWPDAFWVDACGRALGEVEPEDLAASADLEGEGERNNGPFVEAFARERAGDVEGAKQYYEQVLANARHGGHEWPANLARARLEALGD